MFLAVTAYHIALVVHMSAALLSIDIEQRHCVELPGVGGLSRQWSV